MFGSNKGYHPPVAGSTDEKSQFIEQTKQARGERARKVIEESAAIKIQVR